MSPDPEYLTPAEAGRTAFLSVRQLARLADAGRIGFIRPGRHRRYLRSDVEALARHADREPEDDNYKELIEQAIADEPDEFYRLNPEGE